MQVKKQQLELDMKKQTDSKLGREYIKAVYCHLTYLTDMLNTSFGVCIGIHTQAGIKIAGRNINNLRYKDGSTLWQKIKKN